MRRCERPKRTETTVTTGSVESAGPGRDELLEYIDWIRYIKPIGRSMTVDARTLRCGDFRVTTVGCDPDPEGPELRQTSPGPRLIADRDSRSCSFASQNLDRDL